MNEGCANLGRHIGNLKSFGVPVVVAINHFVTDTDAEVAAVKEYVESQGSEAIVSRHWELGSERPCPNMFIACSGLPRRPLVLLAMKMVSNLNVL